MVKHPSPWTAADQAAGQRSAAAWQQFFQAQRPTSTDEIDALSESSPIGEAQRKSEMELLALENVTGVAPSFKVTGGTPTGTRCLTVYVTKKVPKTQLAKEEVVPAHIDGFPSDVVETGPIEALPNTARVRPALPGFSIGHHNITAGTFGCVVRDLRHAAGGSGTGVGDTLILSNNHVLAATNAGKPGDLILQPGPFDGGLFPSDAIAQLDRFEPITFGATGYNLVDAAVARPLYNRDVTASILGLVMPRGVGQALPGMLVVKVGRTTNVTSGFVFTVNATVAVGYGIGTAIYRHQILTTAMSAPGDSGSLLMDFNLNAVGLLFAGSAQITVFNHIGDVELALGVRPLTAPRFA